MYCLNKLLSGTSSLIYFPWFYGGFVPQWNNSDSYDNILHLLVYTNSKYFSILDSSWYFDQVSSSCYGVCLVRSMLAVLLTWRYGELTMSLLDSRLLESKDWVFFILVSFEYRSMCVRSANQQMNELQKDKVPQWPCPYPVDLSFTRQCLLFTFLSCPSPLPCFFYCTPKQPLKNKSPHAGCRKFRKCINEYT